MTDRSTILSLPLIQPAQAQKHVTHNEALEILDVLVQPVVADRTRTAPPAAPAPGDRHIVAAGATGDGAGDGAGDWTGHAGKIAVFAQGGWLFVAPRRGWRVHVLAESADAVFDGAGWGADAPARLDRLGIGTDADAANPLSVAGPATLLTHDGADHRLKLNKAAAGDTASLLFQTGFSGRAEIGLTGSDGFAIKVSADGAGFADALRTDAATGIVSLPALPAFAARGTGSWVEIATADTDLAFGTAIENAGGHFDTAAGRFTAPAAGLYAFALTGISGATSDAHVAVAVNGATDPARAVQVTGTATLAFHALLRLAAGDRVTCRTATPTVRLRIDAGRTVFSGWKVG